MAVASESVLRPHDFGTACVCHPSCLFPETDFASKMGPGVFGRRTSVDPCASQECGAEFGSGKLRACLLLRVQDAEGPGRGAWGQAHVGA